MDWSIVLEVITAIIVCTFIVLVSWGMYLLENDKHEAWKARKAAEEKDNE